MWTVDIVVNDISIFDFNRNYDDVSYLPTKKRSENKYPSRKKRQEEWSKRDIETRKFYNSTAWRKLSKKKLAINPLCEECERNGILSPARHADHIVPIKQGGAKLSLDNLQSLCIPCHSKKTAKEG